MKKSVANNIVMLYLMNFAQLLLPLIVLPYLTRVLTVNGYGVVSYVKSIMMYMTLIIEFGFTLSATKEVVEAKNDKNRLSLIISKVTFAKLFLSIISFIVLLLLMRFIPLLGKYPLFTILSFFPSFLTVFLFDYLFRGLEKMEVITGRYIIMKGLATVLTFILVKGENQILLIPILDIIGSIVANLLVLYEIKKMKLKFMKVKLQIIFKDIATSFVYFISNMASTAFGALTTLFVGIYLSTKNVAYWSIIMTLITAVQSMYGPVSDGIYPRMISSKSLRLFLKIVIIFIPLCFLGAVVTYFGADLILLIIGGNKYVPAAVYLRECIPLFIITFFNIITGWPLLGAIGKIKETTFTTIIGSILQLLLLLVLGLTGNFSIDSLLIVFTSTTFIMTMMKVYYAYKYRYLFNYAT
ncbi:oligosaccharide flippase family protein [Limosilactobacillus reuteri]|uniref:oligosaccharide flippase family protein n=1 Tax=Limosilactobacillus reuteri TaxID=1598 RepID=UPI0039947037